MTRTGTAFILGAGLLLTAASGPAAAGDPAAAITPHGLAAHVRFLADDQLGGRGPATDGDRLTQLYLASQLERIGCEPGGPDGSWFQPFEIVGVTSQVPGTWSFQTPAGEVDLAFRDEFVATSGVQAPSAAIDGAEVVFVGYGIEAPEYDWDDYKGLDVAGKVLLMMNNDPEWDPDLFAGERRLYYGRWTYKYQAAAERGAAGAIIIHTTPSAGYPFQVVQTGWTGEQFELPDEGERRTQIESWVSEDAARRLVTAAGHDLEALLEAGRSRDFQPVPLGITTSLALTNTMVRVETANVAGLLPGTDPELADEVVVYSAHHDHLGRGAADETGDNIYNGALDNASGTAQVLAVAEAFAALPEPPRRSILFLFVAAEEQGLLGSAYYARHPTYPPGRIAANINLDGGNIWGPTRDLTFIGYGKSADLDAVVEAAAEAQSRTVSGDQFPDRGFFYRSDQFNFAKIGVPAIYIDGGTDFIDQPEGWGAERIEEWEARHYHQPSDEIEPDWNFDGMVRDARLALECGMTIADAEEAPRWNVGDEFEAARLTALRDLVPDE